MKKLLAFMLAALLIVTMLAACSNTEETHGNETTAETKAETEKSTEKETEAEDIKLSTDPVRVFTLKGPTGMGMAPIMDNKDAGKAKLNYEFTVADAADQFKGNILKGDFEIACVPTNLAAVLYQKSNQSIQIAAVNTLGVLYVLEDGETVNDIKDLEGKTIYSSGQGAVPEYALNYILDAFGVNCEVIYESEHDLVVADIMTNKADIAILPEPKVTAALKNEKAPEGLRIALDLTELWEEVCKLKNETSALCMGCVIVNKAWAKENPNEVIAFLDEYKESVAFVNTELDTASAMIANYGIIPKAGLAKAAIPNANIVYIDGTDMQTKLMGFFDVLYKSNPASIGGKMPVADIFYIVGKR